MSVETTAVGFSRRMIRRTAEASERREQSAWPLPRMTQGSAMAKARPFGLLATARMRGSRRGGYRMGIG